MDRLELGHQANFTTSIPMKKITKMKFVKYLILILVAVVIHTTYRLLWKVRYIYIADLRKSMYTYVLKCPVNQSVKS